MAPTTIDQGSSILHGVIVKPDPLIAGYITFKEETLTISYSGTVITSLTALTYVSIEISLVNVNGPTIYK